jgi:superfamily II DNA or RNA helicase
MNFVLRPYQARAVDSALEELTRVRSTLIVMPTGTGKTVCFAHIIRRWLADNPGKRVLVAAHREELIYQAADKISSITGEAPAVEMADLRADDADGWTGQAKIIVTSVQTQNAGPACKMCDNGQLPNCPSCIEGRRLRMQHFDPEQFGLLIIDEAHHATAKTYRRVIDYYKHAKLVGFTATPDRADEEALGQIFESVVYHYEIPEAIRDGWLVPIDQQLVRVEDLDFTQVQTTAGDLNQGDLERAMLPATDIDRGKADLTADERATIEREERILHGIVDPTIELAGDKPTLIFTASVAHAERVAEIINRWRNASAVCLHGETPSEDRRQHLYRFKHGEFQFLVNCGLFLEGFDETRIAVVAIARPTKSRALYSQMIGRGTRPVPGIVDGLDHHTHRQEAIAISEKPSLLVLDFVGNSGRHKLVSVADVLGGKYSDDVIESAKAAVAAKSIQGISADMLVELVEAQQRKDEEERKRRQAIRAKAQYSTQQINPFDLLDITPTREPGWHKGRKPTTKQKEMLVRNGIPVTGETTFWQASQLIGELIKRRERGQCSIKQSRLLAKHGYDPNMSFDDARKAIDRLAANHWRRPPEEVVV